MNDVNKMSESSGKFLLDDNTILNIANLLKDIDMTNLSNSKRAIRVDTQGIESSHPEVITTSKTGYDLITPSSGNKIIVHDVFLVANSNLGSIEINFSGGKPIARLYTSQFFRANFSNLTSEGNVDEKIQLTGDASGSGDEIFVLINYVEK